MLALAAGGCGTLERGPAASSSSGEIAVPPDQAVADRSQAEWSKAWWQWAGSFERADSPVTDPTGERCGAKQKGPVWFLAGTYGTARTIRTCTVPRSKYLFFPLVNYVIVPLNARARHPVYCRKFKQTAEEQTDNPAELVLDLDGRRIEDLWKYRQAPAECFDMGALAQPKVRIFPSAANGYYVMLRPLSPGKHVLNFGGVLPELSQAVTYTLFVR